MEIEEPRSERWRPSPSAKLFLWRWFWLAAVVIPLGFGVDWFNGRSAETKGTIVLFVVVFGIPSIAIVAFVLFVWPTLWRYEKVGSTIARIRRFDGTTEVLTAHGWQRLTDSVGLDLGR